MRIHIYFNIKYKKVDIIFLLSEINIYTKNSSDNLLKLKLKLPRFSGTSSINYCRWLNDKYLIDEYKDDTHQLSR